MRILIDECVPRKLKRSFPAHTCLTVQEAGLGGKQNGELLELAEGMFDIPGDPSAKRGPQDDTARRIHLKLEILRALRVLCGSYSRQALHNLKLRSVSIREGVVQQ